MENEIAEMEGVCTAQRGARASFHRLWLGALGLLFLVSLASSGCVQIRTDAANDSGNDGPPRVVWGVEFAFFDSKGKPTKRSQLTSSQLLKAMETGETSGTLAVFRLGFLGKYRIYKRATVLADLQRIKKLYRYHGFYQSQVDFKESRDLTVLAGANRYRKYQRVKVKVRVIEGPQIKVTQIQYRWPASYKWLPPKDKKKSAGVSLAISWTEDGKSYLSKHKRLKGLLDKLKFKVGTGFSTPRYKALKARLMERLQKRSYALGTVKGTVIIDKSSKSAEVVLDILPLVPCKFGNVRVTGNKRVDSKLLKNLIKFKPNGDIYRLSKILNTQRAIFALGVFRTVSVKPDFRCARYRFIKRLGGQVSPAMLKKLGECLKVKPQTPAAANKQAQLSAKDGINSALAIPIVITAIEDKFQLFRAGLGVLIDGQRQLLGASIGWDFKHFLGGLRELKLQFTPGLAFLPDVVRRFDIGPDLAASATFTQPLFMDRQGEVGLRVVFRRPEELGNGDYITLTPSIWFSRPLWKKLTGRFSFNVELAWDVQNPLTLERENYQLAFFEQRFELDLRDDPLDTKRGVYLALNMQQAPFGTFQYVKFSPEIRAYATVASITFAFRAVYGLMFSQRTGQEPCAGGGACVRTIEDVLRQSPLTQRYFTGGANSVRGWTDRYLGPLACRVQKQEYQYIQDTENKDGKVRVRSVRQIQTRNVVVPDPVDPDSASKSERQKQLYPLLNRGKTCRPAKVQVAQSRAADLAQRRFGLPLGGRGGAIPLPQQQSLQVVPTGGHHLLFGSLEIRIPLSFLFNGFGIAVFADAGVIQLEPQIEVLEEFVPSISVGGGFRYRTPFGAFRLDIAGRLFPDDDRYPDQSHWQFHLSFGEAF